MKDRFILGRYLPGDSLIHRLDPRVKLLAMCLLLAVVFFANNIASYLVMLIFIGIIIRLSQLSIRLFVNGLKPMIFIIFFTVFLQLFFTKTGSVIWSWGILTLTSEGVMNAVFIFMRFVIIIFVSTVVTLTTPPLAITDAIESLLSPLKNKLPVHELALMLSISLRFVPTLIEETDKIMDAQRARGVDFSSGSVFTRVRAIVPILIPLFISAFNRAYDLATAMEARGYRGGDQRTKYRILQWQKRDSVALVMICLVMVLVFVARTYA